MADKTPIRTVYTDGVATGLAEYQSGETVGLTHGGLGASLSIGTAGQVLKVNSGASALEFGAVEAIINIDTATDLTSNTLAAGDQIMASDGGSEGRVTLSQLDTLFSGTTKTLTNKTISGSSNTLSNIGNSSLSNSAVTVGSTSISLGASSTTLTGITNLTAGGINITGNSITSADSTVIEMGEGLSVTGNLTVSGNMNVSGTTTTLETTNTVVTDNLLELNSGVTSNSDDSGIIIERGSTGNNAIMFWDESADKFAFGTTTATADSNGNLTVTDGDLRVADISATTYSGAGIKDEDNMASDSATHLASQQSIKKYVDDSILTKDNTDEITEGSTNLYYTDVRADARITNALKDEDNMASDSATHIPSQQSVKAYVDAVTTSLNAQDLDFQGDSGGALNIDLDTEVLDIAGGTGIDTSGSGNTLTVAIDSTVTTLSGTQTLTNKTLTTPVIASLQQASGSNTLTMPAATDTLVGKATTDTLTNKTLTSPKINEDVAVTSTATELNLLDGVTGLVQSDFTKLAALTASATELNYTDGVSSNIQTQIDTKTTPAFAIAQAVALG